VDYEDVKKDGDAVVECYRCADNGVNGSLSDRQILYRRNMSTPLDCWKQVDRFKASVSRVEQVFVLDPRPLTLLDIFLLEFFQNSTLKLH
jgi:hypothetical protein